jgi:hypothetical protein
MRMRHQPQDHWVTTWDPAAQAAWPKSAIRCAARKQQNFERWGWAKEFRPIFSRLQAFSYGVGVAALAGVSLGDLLRVPNIGHVRARLSQLPVRLPPAFIPGLRVQFARLAPSCRRSVTAVCRGRGVH